MTRPFPNPTDAATKWANAMAAAGPAYTAGVQAVTQAPTAQAAAASDRWLAGIQASVPKFKANLQAVTLQDWQNSAVTKGAPRLGSGASAAQDKTAAVFTQLFQYGEQLRNTLPQRGTIDQNIARADAWMRGMNKFVRR